MVDDSEESSSMKAPREEDNGSGMHVYVDMDTDSPTLGLASRSPLDLSEGDLSPARSPLHPLGDLDSEVDLCEDAEEFNGGLKLGGLEDIVRRRQLNMFDDFDCTDENTSPNLRTNRRDHGGPKSATALSIPDFKSERCSRTNFVRSSLGAGEFNKTPPLRVGGLSPLPPRVSQLCAGSSNIATLDIPSRKSNPRIVQVNVQDFESGIRMDKQRKERMEAFGAQSGLPLLQKLILWYGIFSDIMAKVSLIRELSRFGLQEDWVWFSIVFVFFMLSGCLTCMYWLNHYPKPQLPDPKEPLREVFGYRKYDVKVMLRRIGMVCAFFQLGTAFAALRTLRSDRPDRQRKAYMEMRGMRLVDTVFLTLSVASLQCYIGMVCSSEHMYCSGRGGFDIWLFVTVSACIVSGATCYVSFDLKEGALFKKDYEHLASISLVFCYHVTELGARVVTISLFAAAAGGWVFVMFFSHAVIITLLLRYPLVKQLRHVWDKLNRTVQVEFAGRTISVPAVDDVKLLWACLISPTSCYVSDSTTTGSSQTVGGQFWWRVPLRECGKLSFSSVRLEEGIIAFPLFIFVQALESLIMLSVVIQKLDLEDPFLLAYLSIAVGLTLLWLIIAFMWLSMETVLHALLHSTGNSSKAVPNSDPGNKPLTASLLSSSDLERGVVVGDQSLPGNERNDRSDTTPVSTVAAVQNVLLSSDGRDTGVHSLPVGFSFNSESVHT